MSGDQQTELQWFVWPEFDKPENAALGFSFGPRVDGRQWKVGNLPAVEEVQCALIEEAKSSGMTSATITLIEKAEAEALFAPITSDRREQR